MFPLKKKAKLVVGKNVFGDDDDDDGAERKSAAVAGDVVAADAEVDDPLDAFMAEVHDNLAKEAERVAEAPAAGGGGDQDEQKKKKRRDSRVDLDEDEDNVASFLESRRRSGSERTQTSTSATAGAEEDWRKKNELLKPVDHTLIEYGSFNKDFYQPHPSLQNLSWNDLNHKRRALNLRVGGLDSPSPIETFEQAFGDDLELMKILRSRNYNTPTPIQAQAIPCILSGRDVLGIAKTGSGKTAAFLLPLMTHVLNQPKLRRGEGPVAVIVAPTRELAAQILLETRKFTKHCGIAAAGIFGGLSKTDQFKGLKGICDVVVCTPGRMIDLLKMKACTFRRVTYLVLDECDRMLDMGFEQQVWTLVNQVRPNRQTVLFSATMPPRIERLSQAFLCDPIHISVGRKGEANEDIRQVVKLLQEHSEKVNWILSELEFFQNEGQVLVFVNQKAGVEELVLLLSQKGYRVGPLHGDMSQQDRISVLSDFKKGVLHTLVATDLAARGLDIKSVNTVLNFDVPNNLESYIHRVGRTGRAGKKGTAITLLLSKQRKCAGMLVNAFSRSYQNIPRDLYDLALQDKSFNRKQRKGRRQQSFNQSRSSRGQVPHSRHWAQGNLKRPHSSFVAGTGSVSAAPPRDESEAATAAQRAAAAIGKRLAGTIGIGNHSSSYNSSRAAAAETARAISDRINKEGKYL